MHGDVERLALDVPQGQVQRAQRVGLLAAGWIEPGDVCLLPDRVRPERVLADQRPRALLERVLGPALAEAGEPDVGLDRDQHVALVEEGVEGRRPVDPHPRDLRLRQVGGEVRRTQHGGRLEYDSAPGQGTTATIELPAQPPAQAAMPKLWPDALRVRSGVS